MNKGWMIPISSQCPRKEIAHHVVEHDGTNPLVQSDCEMMINIMFAEPAKRNTPKCQRCLRKMK